MQCPEKQSSTENKRLLGSISEPYNFSELWKDLEAEPVSSENAAILLYSRKLLPSVSNDLNRAILLKISLNLLMLL